MAEQQNALKRTSDPRIYAVSVRQNKAQQSYTLDKTRFEHCRTIQDFAWDEIDRPVGGVPCADLTSDPNATQASSWFPEDLDSIVSPPFPQPASDN
jgi:hypothetical protein